MQRTPIDWCDYSANPVQGYCPNEACPLGIGCYARQRYIRFNLDRTVYFDVMQLLPMPEKPSRIFVGSTMELFGEWIKDEWMQAVLLSVRMNRKHTFIFLTKRPENLAKWNPWPDNAWTGVSACNSAMYLEALKGLQNVDSKVRFISFEPLLEQIDLELLAMRYVHPFDISCLDWLIVGSQTGRYKRMPRPDSVKKIIDRADACGVPVFIKDNLKWPKLRQEFPVWRT